MRMNGESVTTLDTRQDSEERDSCTCIKADGEVRESAREALLSWKFLGEAGRIILFREQSCSFDPTDLPRKFATRIRYAVESTKLD